MTIAPAPGSPLGTRNATTSPTRYEARFLARRKSSSASVGSMLVPDTIT
jgi:hypothetical protein